MRARGFISVFFLLSLGCEGRVFTTADGGPLVIGQIPTVLDDAGAPSQSLSGEVRVVGAANAAGAALSLTPGTLTASTDPTGSFFFPSLPAGSYLLTASLPGYATATQTVEVTEGNDVIVSLTLERSIQLLPLAECDSSAGSNADLETPFIGYAQWLAVPDGGRRSGSSVFAGCGGNLWELADGGLQQRLSDAGSMRLLGFDPAGNGVVATSSAVTFLEPGADQTALPLTNLQQPTVVGGTVFVSSRPIAEAASWYAELPGYIAPDRLADDISTSPEPVAAFGGLAGWQLDGCTNVVSFGATEFRALTLSCLAAATPLTASVDGDLVAFIAKPADGEACTAAIFGNQLTKLDDVLTARLCQEGGAAITPLSSNSFLVPARDSNGNPELTVDGPGGTQSFPASNWAPMHAGAVLAEQAGVPNTLTVLGTQISIPFPYAWATPSFSPSNRYVFFPGTPAVFDLVKQLAVPLTVTPQTVAFDRAEARALVADDTGTLAILDLSSLSANAGPAGTTLEGIAVAQSFTADETGVLYFGEDAMGNRGLFVQSLP